MGKAAEQQMKTGVEWLEGVSTELLRAMRDLCPDGKHVRSVSFSAGGETVVLTVESRRRAEAELKRRGVR